MLILTPAVLCRANCFAAPHQEHGSTTPSLFMHSLHLSHPLRTRHVRRQGLVSRVPRNATIDARTYGGQTGGHSISSVSPSLTAHAMILTMLKHVGRPTTFASELEPRNASNDTRRHDRAIERPLLFSILVIYPPTAELHYITTLHHPSHQLAYFRDGDRHPRRHPLWTPLRRCLPYRRAQSLRQSKRLESA